MDPEKLIVAATPSSRSLRRPSPALRIILPVLVFSVILYIIISLRPVPASSATTPLDVAPPAQAIFREACQLRFWKRRALPYCERATADSWFEEEQKEAEGAPLEVFQVYTPPRTTAKLLAGTVEEQATVVEKSGRQKKGQCQSVLMQHTFGWSYGKPFVGECPQIRSC
jgi:hypothetical protein